MAGRCEGSLVFLEGEERKLKWQLILEIDAWQLEMLIVAAVVGRRGSSVEEVGRISRSGGGSGLALCRYQAGGRGRRWNSLILAFCELDVSFPTNSGSGHCQSTEYVIYFSQRSNAFVNCCHSQCNASATANPISLRRLANSNYFDNSYWYGKIDVTCLF